MSEIPVEVEEPQKKKGGKLPIIIALVVLLAGGGFFMMKGQGKKEPPPLKLGTIEPLEEFLVNLQETNVYLRTEIALHLKDKFTKEELDKSLPAVRDIVNAILRSKSTEDIRTADDVASLKRELVEGINKVLEAAEADAHPVEAPPEATVGTAPKIGTAKGPAAGDPKFGAVAKDREKLKAPAHPDWDSQTGPVLKLYFTSFATT